MKRVGHGLDMFYYPVPQSAMFASVKVSWKKARTDQTSYLEFITWIFTLRVVNQTFCTLNTIALFIELLIQMKTMNSTDNHSYLILLISLTVLR